MASLLKTVFGAQTTETDQNKNDNATDLDTNNGANAETLAESEDTTNCDNSNLSSPQPPSSTPPAITVTKKKISNDIMIKLFSVKHLFHKHQI